MTAPAAERPVYDTFEKAAAAPARQRRENGVFTGIVRNGDGWSLLFDGGA